MFIIIWILQKRGLKMSFKEMREAMKSQQQSQLELLKTQMQTERETSARCMQEVMKQLRLQEQSLSEKNAQIELLNGENEKLLKLAENEKKLCDDNEKLKQEIELRRKREDSKDRRLAEQEAEIEALNAEISKLTKRLPAVKEIDEFTYALRQANSKFQYMNILHYVTWTVTAVFLALTLFVGYQAYQGRVWAKNSYDAIADGVYNSKGWSVIEGSRSYQIYMDRVKNGLEE